MGRQKKPDELSIAERILKLQDQWDEIASLPEAAELTPAQLAELERRLQDHRLRRRSYKTWEELRSELEASGDAKG
jgi:putative addiction module component (TIGR02574 family)